MENDIGLAYLSAGIDPYGGVGGRCGARLEEAPGGSRKIARTGFQEWFQESFSDCDFDNEFQKRFSNLISGR
jgi:hypothetical protein